MTDTHIPSTRTAPTPGDLANARPKPAPALASSATRPEDAGVYDRHRWEQALLAADLPHSNARLLGLVLAHLAGPGGYMPAGGMQHAGRLAATARMTARQTRISLHYLQANRLIYRPDIADWTATDVVRPITLTMPPAAATQPPGDGRL
ncbi:hypothetical protein [Streptomyces sp. NPDC088816]|uniref:hypothetical protein n=1 Tax=Streptomyces sp. NPDC088816 TaxID=3365906 RepID=UPI00380BB197